MPNSQPLEMSIHMDLDLPGGLDIFAMTPTLMDGNLSSQNPIRPLYTFGYEFAHSIKGSVMSLPN